MFAAMWWLRDWEAWVFAPALAVFLLTLGIGWRVTNSLKRARFRKIGQRLLPMGYEFVSEPSDGLKEEFFQPFAPLAGWMNLQRGAAGLEWIAMRSEEDQAMRLFEYEFTTGSGKSTQIHMYTLVGWSAEGTAVKGAALGRLAGFRTFPARWGQRRFWKKHALKVPEFDRSLPGWVFTGDESTGRRFLTEEVVKELRAAPKGESWFIGGGWVCCLYQNPLDPEDLLRFVARARRVYSLAG